ncbi:similar to Saccharomyces cerevisiae YKL089W MIF2 Kinetochore protein with homology to human CENP-C [Maudiozyma saulgeensis]|uniref:Similar to Saccharomyces cerevisiae YKL089W MIF2 Kinetochore protein with homology to human CENP-C n=1 Tax=Maudiozyma saulgeensis TaxID=1789683 RepID=A0A1X7R9A1_9SACH|nr:similar to Saccharomyces cerevisiae YKL089W MIF2 Kinetochore protein with homology to human CENP-C [Kazachstania saulgeensis]
MDCMEWGKRSRKTGWVPTRSIQKDEHSMENIDEFFNVTETSGLMESPVKNTLTHSRENVLRQYTPAEMNKQKMTTYSKPSVKDPSQSFEIPQLNLTTELKLDKSTDNNDKQSYETNYNLESENEISLDDADGKSKGSINIPDLRSSRSSDIPQSDTSFNTSENALLEEEIQARNPEIASGNIFDAVSEDIEIVHNDSVDEEYNSRDFIRPTGRIRKSKRIRIPKLDYWRNERIVYKRNNSQQALDIEKIITFAEQEQKKTNKKRSTEKSNNNHNSKRGCFSPKNISLNHDTAAQWLNDGIFNVKFQNGSAKSEAASTVIAMAPEFQQVRKTKNSRFNSYSIDTLFDDQSNFSSGNLTFPKNGIKSEDNTGGCFVTFHVTKGSLKAWIDGQSFICPTGTTFQIPAFKSYKFENISDKETTLFFVQVISQNNVPPPEEDTLDYSSDNI